MTELELFGARVFVDGETITGTDDSVVELVKDCYFLQAIPNYGLEYTIVWSAVNNLGAKIISGDALTTLAPKEGDLY